MQYDLIKEKEKIVFSCIDLNTIEDKLFDQIAFINYIC